ncbi:MAG: protein kinase [Gemmatimonadaceae bacterium]|jgi:serine/threonine protein kinase/tetratricopeptide (TPR) repeat protein|nr:protein kinase [Gemmatimonadota bacterium]MBK7834059.1 protein kinase [Gemmatimonadota bacterium]MBK8060284.1 protein kinase [Gemmatimonadota bacterium]MBK9411270.1 protein kinase [Gemmatimonadota bacterium]MCC7322854.1 protein kinase [Gemmatimonadaceae bacterium]
MATIEPTDVIGSRLSAALAGTYTIERELGGAGMSRVFEARETALDRRVVIKVVTADVGAGVSADRFRREIQVAATLRHPHIVPLLAAGEAAGILYYSMPLIDGESLQQRLARTGPLPVSEVVHLAEEVADALDHAHRLGVIHRDIKPANILLEDEHAIVADFGIARAVSKATEHEGHALTITGLVLGTPLYMSPEQGGGDEVDGRTDIYALGCVMYQMLAGKPPFEGTNAQQIILAHFVKEPPPIDRGDVPDALRDVVRQAMAKDPEQRFASAALMRNALRSLDTRHLPSSPPAVNTTRSFRAVPTGPVSTSLTSGPIDSLAVLPFDSPASGTDDEYLADGITESILNKLTRVSGLRVVPRSVVFRYKRREVDIPIVAAELRVRALVTGRVRQRGNTLHVSAELTDALTESQLWGDRISRSAEDIFSVQEDMAGEIVKSLRLRLSAEERQELVRRYTEDSVAYRAYLRGRYQWNKRTRDGFLKAIEHFQEAIDRDPSYALAYAGLADAYNVLGYYNYLPPRDAYPKAKAAAMRALAIDESLAQAHASLGYTRLFFDWDWAGAESAFLRAIELDPSYASAHQWYAWCLLVMRRMDEMIEAMRTALQLDPLSLIINAHMGYALFWAGRFDDALEQLARTQALDPNFALTYWPLGAIYVWQGRSEEAIAAFSRLVALTDGAIGMGYLGITGGLGGHPEIARDVLHRLEVAAATRYVSPLDRAISHAGIGEVEETFHWLTQAVDDRVSDLVRLQVLPWPPEVRNDPRFAQVAARIGLAV